MKKFALAALLIAPLVTLGQVKLRRSVIGTSSGGYRSSGQLGVLSVSRQSSPVAIKSSDHICLYQGLIQPFDEEFTIVNFQFTLFPNPTSGSLMIRTEANVKDLQLKVSDLNGKQVLSKTFQKEEEINLQGLARGMYLVSLFEQNRFIGSRKLIIK